MAYRCFFASVTFAGPFLPVALVWSLGDILVACGALTELEKDDMLNYQDNFKDGIITAGTALEVPQIGKIAVGQQVVKQAVVDAAIKKQGDLSVYSWTSRML